MSMSNLVELLEGSPCPATDISELETAQCSGRLDRMFDEILVCGKCGQKFKPGFRSRQVYDIDYRRAREIIVILKPWDPK